jgi:phosphatidate cytidylyltransferase
MLCVTEIIIVGLVIPPAYFGGIVFIVVMAGIGLGALRELYALYGNMLPIPLKLGGWLSGAGLFIGAYWANEPVDMYMLIPFIGLLLLTINIFLPVVPNNSHAIGLTLLGIIYPCLFLAHIILISNSPEGFTKILFMYVVLESHDSFAMLGGRFFGRKKMFPTLSPKKTVEGVVCGFLFAFFIALVLNNYIGLFSLSQVLSVALLIVIFTLLGDLAASKLKRDAGVKDFGNLLPKQGGILDIYDSLIFVSPVFYWYIRYI